MARIRGVAEDMQEHGHHLCKHGVGAAWWGLPNLTEHVFGPHPLAYDIGIPVSTACIVIIMLIIVPHLATLCRKPPADRVIRANNVRVVASVPLVIGLAKWIAVILPRDWKMLFLLASLFEVFAFWNFMRLILSLVAQADIWNKQDVIDHLRQDEEVKMWAVPPLCCCFKPCLTARWPRKRDLHIQRLLMWQFVFICPGVTFLEWTELKFVEEHKIFGTIESISLMLAMYGLFALLEATQERLEQYRSHMKFWTIKGVFIANTAIFRAVMSHMTYDVRIHKADGGSICYSNGAMASAWAGTYTVVLCVPLAVLAKYAFVWDDVVADCKIIDNGENESIDCIESGSDSSDSSVE